MAYARLPGELESRKCTDALDAKGYVLELASDGTVKKATTRVYGIAYRDTVNPVTEQAEANKYVPIITEGFAYVQAELTADVAIGDYVGLGATAGKVDKLDVDTSSLSAYEAWRKKLVGIALEAKSAGYEGLLLVRLCIRG